MTDPIDAVVRAPIALAAARATQPAEVDPVAVDPVAVDHPGLGRGAPMSDALADATVSQLASEMPQLTAEQVKAVVAALNTVQTGDEVGIVRKSADGVFAVRISLDGVHKWHLVNPSDGTRWDDNENSIIMTWPTVP